MTLPLYIPPTDDEPLDAVQQAIVLALVTIISDRMRARRAAEQQIQIAEREKDAPEPETVQPRLRVGSTR